MLIYAKTWMNFKNTMVSERIQTKSHVSYDDLCIYEIFTLGKSIEKESILVVAKEIGDREQGVRV